MNRTLKILLMTDACFIFAVGLFGPIYAIFVNDIGGDLLDAGWAWAAFMLTAGVVVFLMSRWENRVRHYEQLVIGGYAVRSLAIFGYIFVGSPLHLMAVQALLGIGEAFTIPAYDALFTMHIDHGQEASQWGNWEAMYYIVTSMSAILGAAAATAFGFQALFVMMFGVSIVGLLLSIRLMPEIISRLPKTVAVLITGKAGVRKGDKR
ncbi:MFS transporter [Candidatus Woesearchaeota archaeon]|nr:MFS transporter [Candidatus Woesearchaeota archaeon]